jgi:redox-sensitive bicupin YhaK (pirin superfamily)
MVQFNNDAESIELEALENTRFIILSGEPLNEPLATHRPFVMNNQTEIMEAIRDYQMGKMGHLVEEFK